MEKNFKKGLLEMKMLIVTDVANRWEEKRKIG